MTYNCALGVTEVFQPDRRILNILAQKEVFILLPEATTRSTALTNIGDIVYITNIIYLINSNPLPSAERQTTSF